MYNIGIRLVWHDVAADGFTTYIGFFPEANRGLVIRTNIGPTPLGSYVYR